MKFFVLIVIKYIILKNGMSPNLVMAPALGAGIISVQIRAFRLENNTSYLRPILHTSVKSNLAVTVLCGNMV